MLDVNVQTYYPPARSFKQPRLGTDGPETLKVLESKMQLAKVSDPATFACCREYRHMQGQSTGQTGVPCACRPSL